MPSSGQQFKIALSSDPARGATRMTCVQAHCENERNGWVTVLDPEDAGHARALRWLHGDQGRRFIELRSEDAPDWLTNHGAAQGVTDHEGKLAAIAARTPPGMVLLVFPPGQQCFRPHADRWVDLIHQGPRGGRRLHERGEDFTEHMNEEADRVAVLRQRG